MSPTLALVVVDEVEARIDLVPLDRDVVIGRGRGCDVVIRDSVIARRHAEIALTGPDALVVRSHAPSFGGVVLDGGVVTGSRTVDPASEHRLQLYQHTVYITPTVDETVARVRDRLDALHAEQLAVWRVADEIGARQRGASVGAALAALPRAELVIVAAGGGWLSREMTLFTVRRRLHGPSPGAAPVVVSLTPAQRIAVGLRSGVQRRVVEAFTAVGTAAFSGDWILQLRPGRPTDAGEATWLPVDETFGVLPATADLVGAALHTLPR